MAESRVWSVQDQVEEVVGAEVMKHHSEEPTARWSREVASRVAKVKGKEEPPH
jgi:hypothetical protein